ncbi:MAG: hypothetical protein U1E05_01965, partial [Patescibacteria group bacterium]|nr:hypothetical protein [Patescibacteria group bacterium]
MRKTTKVILGIVFAVIGVLGAGYVVLCLSVMQSFSSPVLAVIPSPASSKDEVWLLEEVFVYRGVSLFVKSPSLNGGKPKRITSLDWDGLYS